MVVAHHALISSHKAVKLNFFSLRRSVMVIFVYCIEIIKLTSTKIHVSYEARKTHKFFLILKLCLPKNDASIESLTWSVKRLILTNPFQSKLACLIVSILNIIQECCKRTKLFIFDWSLRVYAYVRASYHLS